MSALPDRGGLGFNYAKTIHTVGTVGGSSVVRGRRLGHVSFEAISQMKRSRAAVLLASNANVKAGFQRSSSNNREGATL